MKTSLIKLPDDIVRIKHSGAITAAILKSLSERATIGTRLQDFDNYARELISDYNAQSNGLVRSAFLGYRPYGASTSYPATICTSMNDTIVHGLPTSYALKEGDLLKLDFGVVYEGLYSDAALTIPIGNVSQEALLLLRITREALFKGIDAAVAGNRLGDIGSAIQAHVRTASGGRFSIVHGLTGHGVGYALHEDPSVYNYGEAGKGMLLRQGMVLALEPMVSAGDPRIVQRPDDSFGTFDGSLSAHFEHTIIIMEKGPAFIATLPS